MKRMLIRFTMLFLFCTAQVSLAIEPYEFPDEDTRKRFQQLTFELRCPKCQNQNIADSNAPIAKDLRREVHRMLIEGRENREVVDFMVARYGDFVLYRPPFSLQTVALWTLPIVFVLFGLGVALWLGRASNSKSGVKDEMTPEEKQRLKQLLEEAESSPP